MAKRPKIFNSRSLRGERQKYILDNTGLSEFQFTLPAWGAMDLYFHVYTNLEISIHVPRMGSDLSDDCYFGLR